MKISIVINCDTRPHSDAASSYVGEHGNESLPGCRSLDFLTHGVVAKNRFLESAGVERETILYVDLHEVIPGAVMDEIHDLMRSGEITTFVTEPHSKSKHRWNDRVYLQALEYAKHPIVAHWDGDCVGYRRSDFDMLKMYLGHLDSGYKFVCQQTPLNQGEHKMYWASTRFFMCRKEELDIPELYRLLDDGYRNKKFNSRHLPCLEHILGAMAGDGKVLYPPEQNEDFVVWSWVKYFSGTLEKLNVMPYRQVHQYVFDKCGGVHGASDLVGEKLE